MNFQLQNFRFTTKLLVMAVAASFALAGSNAYAVPAPQAATGYTTNGGNAGITPVFSGHNQYGQATEYLTATATGGPAMHLVFSGADKQVITADVVGGYSKYTFPTGSVTATYLKNGIVSVTVAVSKAGCGYQAGTQNVTFDTSGNPLSSVNAQLKAQELQKALWCSAGGAQKEYQNFLTVAGVNYQQTINSWVSKHPHAPNAIYYTPYMYHTQDGWGCAFATGGFILGMAAFAAMPADPLAYWGMAAAGGSMLTDC